MSALKGLKIVDFSRYLPGAYASWIAADMGAEVIRIEHPRELAKHEAMFGSLDEAATLRRRARPTYARNKKSMMINPGADAARPVLEKLIAEADILIEDYRPGVMAKMGYGYAAMIALNPRLIYLSVSFAGQTGPLAGKAGHDPAALSLAGALSRLNGLPTPTLPGLQVADVLTGAHATIAMLLALQARQHSTKGQHIDVAMSDASMPLLMVGMGRVDDMDELPKPGLWHPKGGVWECADGGYLCTTDMEPAYWARFCEAIGKPEFTARQHDLSAHRAMEADLRALFLTRSRDEWYSILTAADTQVMPVYSAEEAMNHPQNRDRGMLIDVPVDNGSVRQLGLPFKFSETISTPPTAAGLAGADNSEILDRLGFSQSDLEIAGAFSTETGVKK